MFSNKSGKEQLGAFVLVALVIGAIFLFSNANKPQAATPSGGSGQQPPATAANTVQIVGAPCTQGTTLTSSVIRRYTDVSQGAQNVTILQKGVDKSTTAHGSTVTVQSGPNADQLDFYTGFESTTFYPQHTAGKIETCTSSATTGDPVFKFVKDTVDDSAMRALPSLLGNYEGTPNKVVQIDTAPTITIVNDGQANQNTGGQGESTGGNLTLGSGGSGSVTINLDPAYNSGWGVIGGNVLACQFSSAVYDSAAPIRASVGGVSLSETNIKPSATTYPLRATNSTIKAFAFPPMDSRLQQRFVLVLQLRASTNNNPDGNLDRINCTIADTGYYKKQGDGKYTLDIENRDTNADLGGANTVYDFEIGVE